LGSLDFSLYSHIGGLIVGLMRGAKQDFGPGLSSLIAAAQGGRRGIESLRHLQPVHKDGGLRLGSGASLGPEGPSVKWRILRAACSSAANVPRATTLALGAGLLLAWQLGLMPIAVFSLP